MSTLADLFNPGSSVVEERKETEVYSVSFKKGKNNVYKSIIRFIPWYQNPNANIMDKYVTYVKNPTNRQIGRYIDNPKGGGSPVSEMYWRLVNTQDQRFIDFAKDIFGSKRQFSALVQIMADEQQPELVGKIKVFKFGKTIMDKIKAEEQPVYGEGTNPFHPIYGRKFLLVVTEKAQFNNYDQSQFITEKDATGDKPSGMWLINPATNQYEVVCESNQHLLMDYLQANSPDLSKYDVQPWTEADQKFVTEVLTACENYVLTGAITAPAQMATQQSFGVLNGAPVAQPVFPGATIPGPGAAPTQTPVAPVAQPVFPGSAIPTAPVAPVAQPTFPGAVPPVGATVPGVSPTPTPVPVAPVAQPVFPGSVPPPAAVAPVAPAQPMVSGVEIPTVTPQGAPAGSPAPSMGMNVDDILSQL